MVEPNYEKLEANNPHLIVKISQLLFVVEMTICGDYYLMH